MKKYIIVTILYILTSSGFSATKFQEKQFVGGDKDGDGFLSKEEYVEIRLSVFEEFAKKNNREFDSKKTGKQLASVFAKHDANKDGKLSKEEFLASFAKKK